MAYITHCKNCQQDSLINLTMNEYAQQQPEKFLLSIYYGREIPMGCYDGMGNEVGTLCAFFPELSRSLIKKKFLNGRAPFT